MVTDPGARRAGLGSGTVHPIAFRTGSDAEQSELRNRLAASGIPVSEVLDRNYFRSLYFREPGGVLLEVATDPPGFSVDETVGKLGHQLRLPAWLEAKRQELEQKLPHLETGE